MFSLARFKVALVTGAVTAAVGVPIGLGATAAQAAASASTQATAVAPPGVAGPNGAVPAAWVQQRSSELHPDMPGPNGTHPVARVEKRGGVTPDSASGCNQSVCINVVGSGLYVSDWSTTAYPSTYVCSYAAYWANGIVIATSNEVCGNQNDVFYSDWNNPGYFPNNTQVCNTWLQIAGKPCETVYS
jgi:hypothetical protein